MIRCYPPSLSTATAERSLPTLSRLNDWFRNSSDQEKSTGLALMSMYRVRDMQVSADEVIEDFVRVHAFAVLSKTIHIFCSCRWISLMIIAEIHCLRSLELYLRRLFLIQVQTWLLLLHTNVNHKNLVIAWALWFTLMFQYLQIKILSLCIFPSRKRSVTSTSFLPIHKGCT